MLSSKSKAKPSHNPLHEWAFEAIGTQWWIGIYQPQTKAELTSLQTAITILIEDYDKTFSRFRPDSTITAISKQVGTYTVPTYAEPLLGLYRTLYEVTDGLVTPLVGQQLSDAGYDANYSLQPKTVRSIPKWDDVLEYSNHKLTAKKPVLLDFGAAGKGYLVDLLYELFAAHGLEHFCIDASGDLRTKGLTEPLRIGMEHPDDPTQAIGVINLQNQALCASAPTRRAWADYTHIMNPRSKTSPSHIKAVWVTADSCAIADGLTTALFFTDPVLLANRFTFEYSMVYADSSIVSSQGWNAELFTKRSPHA